jgi:CRP/FNR family transcriptional regulator
VIDGASRSAFEKLLADGAPLAVEPLLRTARMVHAAAGEVLIHDNEPAAFAGVLVEGRLRTVVNLPDGRSASIHYIRPTAFFGLPTVFTPTPLSVHAVTEASAIRLDAATVIESLGAVRGFGWFIARQLAMAVARVPHIIEHFGFLPVRQRLASHLIALTDSDRYVEVTQAALADYVGTAREVVSRTLHAMAGDGLIAVEHRRISILDFDGLRSEAGRASMDRVR